jgi:hypothetical protein
MKKHWMLFALIMILSFSPATLLPQSNEKASQSELLAYAGKSYAGFQDPEFIKYDTALREYEVRRIKVRFGVTLDPKTYSGFDLLQIEALFKCKESSETFDMLLGKFQKGSR